MVSRSVHVSQHVRCPAQVAYAFASDPANLPVWAAGLGGRFTQVDGRWRSSTPDGDVELLWSPPNDFGVLDHTVLMPDGTSVYNPLRVLVDADGCEVVFTLRQRPSMTDEELAQDAAAVAQDLQTLARVLESRSAPP